MSSQHSFYWVEVDAATAQRVVNAALQMGAIGRVEQEGEGQRLRVRTIYEWPAPAHWRVRFHWPVVRVDTLSPGGTPSTSHIAVFHPRDFKPTAEPLTGLVLPA